jgi:RND family efflux transporter MFP subunit
MRIPVLLLMLILVVSLAVPGIAQNNQPSSTLVKVVSQRLEKTISVPSDLAPFQSVAIHAKVQSFVQSLEVDRGSWVKEGQLLGVLAAPELRAQRLEAEAKIQRIESQRAEAESKLAALQATLASTQSTYDRLKAASQTPGVVAGNDLDVAQRTVEAQRLTVEAQRSSVDAILKEKSVAEAAVGVVKELEQYLRVVAPFEGVITERNVHPGSLVGPSGVPIVRIEQVSKLRMIVPVPEAYVGSITRGARVSFKVAAFPDQVFQGTVMRPAHSLDVKTRSMLVELDVANPNRVLAPGMFAEAQWPVSRGKPSLFVPTSAVVRSSERQFVVRVRYGVAEWVDVRRGEVAGDLIEVFGDLREGDTVLRRGNDEIRPGTRISGGTGAASMQRE